MQPRTEPFTRCKKVAVVVAVLAISGCTESPPTANTQAGSALIRPAISAEARLELDRTSNDMRLAREVIRNAATDASKNSDKWFGKKSERNRERFCDGMGRLVTTYMAKAELATGTQYDPARKERIMLAALNGAGCAPPTTMNVFGSLALSRLGVSEGDVDITDALWSALATYQDYSSTYGPGHHPSFCSGLTAMEVEVFDSTATRSDSELAYYEEYEATNPGGPVPVEPMSLFFFQRGSGGLRRAVVSGCISNTTTNASSIVSGARAGASLCGFWCAVGAAVAVATETCAWGALGGYAAWKALENTK